MSLEIIHTVWDELKGYLSPADRVPAAETLVDILIHYDYDLRDLHEEFSADAEVRDVIAGHADDLLANEEEDYEYEQDSEEDEDSGDY